MGTHWKLEGNMLRRNEKGKQFSQPSPCPNNLKGKKSRHFDCTRELFISKTVGHHFWLGLLPQL
jgi:hypothetical protein